MQIHWVKVDFNTYNWYQRFMKLAPAAWDSVSLWALQKMYVAFLVELQNGFIILELGNLWIM